MFVTFDFYVVGRLGRVTDQMNGNLDRNNKITKLKGRFRLVRRLLRNLYWKCISCLLSPPFWGKGGGSEIAWEEKKEDIQ